MLITSDTQHNLDNFQHYIYIYNNIYTNNDLKENIKNNDSKCDLGFGLVLTIKTPTVSYIDVFIFN